MYIDLIMMWCYFIFVSVSTMSTRMIAPIYTNLVLYEFLNSFPKIKKNIIKFAKKKKTFNPDKSCKLGTAYSITSCTIPQNYDISYLVAILAVVAIRNIHWVLSFIFIVNIYWSTRPFAHRIIFSRGMVHFTLVHWFQV